MASSLDHLGTIESLVMDRGAWLMAKAKHQLHLGMFPQAKKSYMSVFERGVTDDYVVHSGYMCALLQMDPLACREALKVKGMDTLATTTKLTPQQAQIVLASYQGELQSRFPRSQAIVRITLTLLEGDSLRMALDSYCRKRLSQGVPSLGMDLSALLLQEESPGKLCRVTDAVDVKSHPNFLTLVQLADSYIENLQSHNKFAIDDDKEESPSTILWAWYLRAGLHELATEYLQGIALLDQCLDHTPTAVDIYELKARLLQGAGNIQAAVECLDKGRDLDKQDRYINNQTTKYMLQAGMRETALERISLFTKHEGNPEHNIFTMQCSWYELELAACLARKELWGLSLKKFRKSPCCVRFVGSYVTRFTYNFSHHQMRLSSILKTFMKTNLTFTPIAFERLLFVRTQTFCAGKITYGASPIMVRPPKGSSKFISIYMTILR